MAGREPYISLTLEASSVAMSYFRWSHWACWGFRARELYTDLNLDYPMCSCPDSLLRTKWADTGKSAINGNPVISSHSLPPTSGALKFAT